MIMSISLGELNTANKETFVSILGGIFEHSPWVAEQAFTHRPYANVINLHHMMVEIVQKSSIEDRKKLICSHPELAGKEAEEGTLTSDSKSEQASAGLDQCTPEEYALLNRLNGEYREKFHFPFIIAVRGRNRQQILADIELRLANSPQVEFNRCIEEIGQIAQFRLAALLSSP